MTESSVDDARAVAAQAAAQAGVETWSITANDELALVDPLFDEIWQAEGPQIGMPVNLLRALVLSGNYVSGAWRDGRLIGAAVGFIGHHDGVLELHSHVAGVARGVQATGVGYALKLHQRAWALENGILRVAWTFDPLVRRNAWFNLVKLGAEAVSFHEDLYGVMVDDLNGTDETDRCLIHWDVSRPWPPAPPPEVEDAPVLLRVDASDHPEVVAVPTGREPIVLCQIPHDIVAIRQADAGLAREWRVALRETMGVAMGQGRMATSISRQGWYRLEPGPG